MNKAKALLDSLMGPSRDVNKKDRKNAGEEFNEPSFCKHYLVGCCPHGYLGKKLEAIRTEFDRPSILNAGGCELIHSVGMKTEFQQHPQSDKFKREYEKSLWQLLEAVMKEADTKVSYERKKRTDMGDGWGNHERLCEVCAIKYKLERRGYADVVGTGPDSYKTDHHETDNDVHKAYVKLRAKLDEMRVMMKEREEADKQLAGADAEKQTERDDEGKEQADGDGKADRDRQRSKSAQPADREKKGDRERKRSSSGRGRHADRGRRKDDDSRSCSRGDRRHSSGGHHSKHHSRRDRSRSGRRPRSDRRRRR